MAAETHNPLGDGSAFSAPTAPHATPPPPGTTPSGPARFWDGRAVRIAFRLSIALSIVFHLATNPWSIFPEQALEFRDTDGELTIPIEFLNAPEPPPPPPPPPKTVEPPKPAETNAATEKGLDAGLRKKRDGGRDAGREAGLRDAGDGGDDDAEVIDAAPVALAADAEAIGDGAVVAAIDGASDAGGDAALLAATGRDGGALPSGAGGPRDPEGLLGDLGAVQSGPPLVVLLVNADVLRGHPVGSRLGPLLKGIPQWSDFMAGTDIEPIRDTDWVLIFGPGLIHTDRDAILVRYNAKDAVVDRAVSIVAKKYDRGGAFDAGVPGVRAVLGHADRAPRVFLRAQPHLLIVVPPDAANLFAKAYSKAKVTPQLRPGEALRLSLQNPNRPMPFIPPSVKAFRLWIVPAGKDGAEVFAEGDCDDAAQATAAADELKKVARRMNSMAVAIVTGGVLNGLEIFGDGPTVRLKMPVSRDQLEVVLAFVAGQLGVVVDGVDGGR